MAYYVVFAPAGTSLQTRVAVAGQRWRIGQSFALAKGEVGLDQYEVRRWDGWYRHMTLAMFALAYLAVLRTHNGGEKGGNAQLDLRVTLLPLTVPEIRHVPWALSQASSPAARRMVIHWSEWRRRHQAHARRYYYRHRLTHS